MKLLLALRMGADISVWGAIVMLIPPFASFGPFVCLCAGLAFLGTCLSGCLRKAGAVRFVPLLLPLAALAVFAQTAQTVIAAVFTAYLLFMAGGGNEMNYWRYKPVYCCTAGLAMAAIALAFICKGETGWICVLAVTQILVNGFVLRQLRFGVSDARSKVLDIVSILAVLGALAVIGCLMFAFLQNDLSFLQHLLWPFAWLMQKLAGLFTGLTDVVVPEVEKMQEQTKITEEILAQPTMEPEITIIQPVPPDPFPWSTVLAIAALVLAVYLIWRLLKWMKGSITEATGAASLELETESLQTQRREKTGDDGDSVRKIRKVYRDYLRYLQSRGLFFEKSRTSLDVEEAAEKSSQAMHAGAIRQSYIRVRYGGHVPQAQDVREAKKLLKEIRNQKK